jgi:hypothetical protein
MSQGFGYVDGIGVLHDEGGDDVYHCDLGDPALEGTSRYPSPQLKHLSNTSMCQGAALGLRHTDSSISMSGGLGILRDQSGDDQYEASVYAQGVGYWQGTGMLIDGQGYDTYDALYYSQGVGVHFAQGIHLDQGKEDDRYGANIENLGLSLGTGHDFGLGVSINEGGNDHYRVNKFSAGGTSCNGRGLFLEVSGDDTYLIESIHSLGVGNAGECVNTRTNAPSIGVMLDGDGNDEYISIHGGEHQPGNERSWNHTINKLDDEIGIGLDASSGQTLLNWRHSGHSSRQR